MGQRSTRPDARCCIVTTSHAVMTYSCVVAYWSGSTARAVDLDLLQSCAGAYSVEWVLSSGSPR